MANVNSVQHAAGVEQRGPFMWATYEIATALSAADTITFFEVPEGTTVLMGWMIADDIDTGTEALEIDVGDSDDPDRFLNSGVITGDAFAAGNVANVAGISYPLYGTLKDGPHTYTSATNVIGTITAAANAGGTGTITLMLFVSQDDARVSPPEAPVS